LFKYLWVFARKGPDTIQDVIIDDRHGKTNRISYKFVDLKFFFAEPSKKEINGHTQEAYRSEFKSAQKKL